MRGGKMGEGKKTPGSGYLAKTRPKIGAERKKNQKPRLGKGVALTFEKRG